jgi:hypothetical protein
MGSMAGSKLAAWAKLMTAASWRAGAAEASDMERP